MPTEKGRHLKEEWTGEIFQKGGSGEGPEGQADVRGGPFNALDNGCDSDSWEPMSSIPYDHGTEETWDHPGQPDHL